MEPGEDEVEAGPLVGRAHHAGRRDGAERPDQVGPDARRRLEGEDPARPQEVDRQLGRDLAGQEQPEAGVRLDGVQLLLQRGQPRGGQVHVFQQDPPEVM